MIIQLDDDTRIKGTPRCWELQRLRNYKGNKRWEPYKWFSTFRQALDEAVHSEIRTFPATGLSNAIEACNRVTQKYAQIFDDVGKKPKDAG